MSLRIDIRDKRLPGNRLTLDAKTTKRVERRRREATVRALIDQGEMDLIAALRRRRIDIADLQRVMELPDQDRAHALVQLRQRAGLGPRMPTLAQAIDRTIETRRPPVRAERTWKRYGVLGRSMKRELGEDTPVDQVLTKDVESYITKPRGKAKKPWGPSRQLAAVEFGGLVWNQVNKDEEEAAEQEGRRPNLLKNVWRRATAPKYRSPRVEYLRPPEWVALRDATRGRAVCAMLGLGARGGLRAEEMAYLRTDVDVDLEKRLIHVRPRGGEWPWKPKSVNGTRTVPMPDDLYEILLEHRRLFAGRTFFVVAPGNDRPLSHSAIINWTRAAFQAVGLRYGRTKDGLTYHSLRHTYASWLTQKGMHPKKVARLIGDTPQEVLKTYGHLAEDDHPEAVGMLNDAVRS